MQLKNTMKEVTKNKVYFKYINLMFMSLVLLSLTACKPKSPSLDNAPDQVYTKDVSIANLVFNNTGGGELTNCSADSLPAGLSVAKSADNTTCEITGTPTAVQVATTHTITATNATGGDTATVSIEVKTPVPPLALPALDNATAQVYIKDTAIANLVFNNTGGGELTSCSADSLPAGLSVAKSADNTTCEITGTPTAVQVATTHTITATNATGGDTATVSIEVKIPVPPLALPALDNATAQVYIKDTAIANLVFNNTGGGELTSCSADSLPTGLSVAKSVDNTTCEITGTPTAVQVATTHTITATNATGDDTATVSIEVKVGVVDTTAPKIVSRFPDDTIATRKDVKPDITISVTFNEAMLARTLTSTSFYLKRGSSPDPLPVEVLYDPATFTVTLKPDEPLKFWTGYELILDGDVITDVAGNFLRGGTHRLYFTTKKGPWQNAQQVTYKKNGFDLNHSTHGSPQLVMNKNDNALLVWSKGVKGVVNKIWAARYSLGVWEEGGTKSIQSGVGTTPSLGDTAINNALGNAVAVWSENGYVWANYFSANQWGSAVNLGKGTTNNFVSQVAMDTAGNAIAVWEKLEEGDRSATYLWGASYSIASNSWSTSFRVSKRYRNDEDKAKDIPMGGNIYNPSVIFDKQNIPIIVWGDSYSLWVAKGIPQHSLSARVLLPASTVYDPVRKENTTKTYYIGRGLSLAGANDDVLISVTEHIIVNNRGTDVRAVVVRYKVSGAISIHLESGRSAEPLIKSNDNGTMTMWIAGPKDGSFSTLSFSHYTPGNGWEDSKIIQTMGKLDYFGSFDFAMSNKGNAFAIWEQTVKGSSSQIWASRYDIALDKWQEPKRVDTILGSGQALYPNIVIDSTGKPLAVWAQNQSGSSYILYYSNTLP